MGFGASAIGGRVSIHGYSPRKHGRHGSCAEQRGQACGANPARVEIKSVDKHLRIHSAQLMTYMRLQGVSSGLLMNFNV
ncbi:MAG: GxxExxY protein, partial [Chloroflexi bacterium]